MAGLAAAAPGVATFGEESKLMTFPSFSFMKGSSHQETIYWREASSGHSRLGYFVGKVLSTLPRLTLSALHYSTFYAIFATPIIPFNTLYVINLLYFYCKFYSILFV